MDRSQILDLDREQRRQLVDLHDVISAPWIIQDAGLGDRTNTGGGQARLIIFYPRSGICQYPQVKGLTVMVNSVYNGCLRATFIADPEGITVNDLSVGRNPEEVLRMLDALKPMSCARAIGRRARRR